MKATVLGFIGRVSLWLALFAFTTYANHGAFETRLVLQISSTGKYSFEPFFPVGGSVAFMFGIDAGTPFTPSPTCAGVELQGWRIRKLTGEPLTDLVRFSDASRCVEPLQPVRWTWNARNKNGIFVRAGTYVAELVTAGTPAHDGIYGTTFRLVNLPDLIVREASLALTPQGAQQITVDVANLSATRARPVEVSFFNSCEALLIGTRVIRFLRPHEVESVSIESEQLLDKTCIGVEVDPKTYIAETDDGNNCLPPPCSFFAHEPDPEPVLSFSITGPLPIGTVTAVPLQISWASAPEFFRSGLASYQLVVLVGGAEIAGVDFVAFKGAARVARDKRSVTITAKDKKNSVPPGILEAVLAQIKIRALSLANVSLQIQVLQLIDDYKRMSKYVLRETRFTPFVGPNREINHSLVRIQLSPTSVQFVPVNHDGLEYVRVTVLDLGGRPLFESGPLTQDVLKHARWELRTPEKNHVASGVYFYTVTAQMSNGTQKTEIDKLVIFR